MNLTTFVIFMFMSYSARAALFLTKNRLSDHEFVIKITDPKTIKEARRIIAERDNESSLPWIFGGTIVKSSAPYNPEWSFHMDPNSKMFFGQYFFEVCDAHVTYVEEHLDEACDAFLPDCFWCPWAAYLAEELEE